NVIHKYYLQKSSMGLNIQSKKKLFIASVWTETPHN
ncbi:MAG: hypothetical protein ACI9EV_002990, partial [Urechidicola sp.]